MSLNKFLIPFVCCVFVLAVTTAHAGTVINEFWADDDGADTNEFVELFGAPNGSLSGLSLIVVDGDTSGNIASSNYRSVKIQVDFTSETLNSSGFYMLGFGPDITVDAALPASIQNGSQTYALVDTADIAYCTDPNVATGCTSGTGTPHIDPDELTPASVAAIIANLTDAVATTNGSSGDHVYFGAPDLTSAVSFAADTAQREPNGFDTDAASDWFVEPFFSGREITNSVATPGTFNIPEPTSLVLVLAGLVGMVTRRRL